MALISTAHIANIQPMPLFAWMDCCQVYSRGAMPVGCSLLSCVLNFLHDVEYCELGYSSCCSHALPRPPNQQQQALQITCSASSTVCQLICCMKAIFVVELFDLVEFGKKHFLLQCLPFVLVGNVKLSGG